MQSTVAVVGASGTQGRGIVGRLVELGHRVVALSRSDHVAADTDRIEWRVADLDAQGGLEESIAGAQSVIYTYPIAFDLAVARARTERLVNACRLSNVEVIAFNTSVPLASAETGVHAIDIKRKIADQLRGSPIKICTIEPTLYLGNLLAPWSMAAIANDRTIVYPLPADLPVSWSLWDDVAVAFDGLYKDGFSRSRFRLNLRPSLTGNQLASVFSRVRGSEHRYHALPIGDFEAGLAAALGPQAASELARLYAWLARDGRSELAGERTHDDLDLDAVDEWIEHQTWRSHCDA